MYDSIGVRDQPRHTEQMEYDDVWIWCDDRIDLILLRRNQTAVKMAGKIAKWGWIILPFPYDIVTGLVAFFISIFVFMALPIIPIRKAYKEQSME